MAIDPANTETTDVSKLQTLAFALNNLLAHATPNGKLYKGTINDLATFIAPYVATLGESAFLGAATPATDPDDPTGTAFYIGATGSYPNFGPSEITGVFGFLIWDGDSWEVLNVDFDLSGYLSPDKSSSGGVEFAGGRIDFDEKLLFPSNQWAIELWLTISDKDSVQVVFSNGVGMPSLLINSGNIAVTSFGVFTGANIPIQAEWVDNKIFLVISFDGGAYSAKVNDVAVTVNTLVGTLYTKAIGPFIIGSLDDGTLDFSGVISLMRIYNGVLSDLEKTAHYNSGFVSSRQVKKDALLKMELLPENISVTKWHDTSATVAVGSLIDEAYPYGQRPEDLAAAMVYQDNYVKMDISGNTEFPNDNYFGTVLGSIEIQFSLNNTSAVQVLFYAGTSKPIIYVNAGQIIFGSADIGTILTFSAAPFLNKKRFLTINFDSGSYNVYIDGVSTSYSLDTVRSFNNTPNPMYLGSSSGAAGLSGSLYMFRSNSVSLTQPEITRRYNSGMPQEIVLEKTSSVLFEAYAKNANSEKWFDTSSSQNHGIVTGTQTVASISHSEVKEIKRNFLSAIPDTIYVALDRELNIWFSSFIPYYGNDFVVNVSCAVGFSRELSFRYTPTVVESNVATFQVKDLYDNIVEEKEITITSVAKNAGSGTKQLLFIGDSTTDSLNPTDYPVLPVERTRYEMIHEISDLITADGGITPLFLGLRGVSPYKHQAHSGYSTDLFVTNNPSYPNPFWDGVRVNFKNYMSTNSNFGGADRIDYAFIQLGINDLKYPQSPTIPFNNIKSLVASILNPTYGYPLCKIIISISPYAGITRDGWALNFAAISDYETYVSNMVDLAKLLVAEFDANPDNPNCYIAPNMLYVDRKYGYPLALTDVSARSNRQELEYTDSVHPDTSGYLQAADSYYSRLRSIL